jgi:hypothetical protein
MEILDPWFAVENYLVAIAMISVAISGTSMYCNEVFAVSSLDQSLNECKIRAITFSGSNPPVSS